MTIGRASLVETVIAVGSNRIEIYPQDEHWHIHIKGMRVGDIDYYSQTSYYHVEIKGGKHDLEELLYYTNEYGDEVIVIKKSDDMISLVVNFSTGLVDELEILNN